MRRVRGWGGRIVGLAGLLALPALMARPAAAQTYGLFVGNSFTINGLSLTVTGCSVTLASATATGCGTNATNAYAEITALAGGAAGTAAFKMDKNQAGGGDLFSVASTAPANRIYDLVYTLSVKPPAGNALSSVANTLAGTSSAAAGKTQVTDTQRIYAGTTTVGTATPIGNLTPTGASLGTQALNLNTVSATTPITPASALSVTTDLKLTSGGAYALKLSSVAQTYSFGRVPEPVSIGLFLVGLAGLGAARLRLGRSPANRDHA